MGIKQATKRDVIWNYIGTFISMGSSFILLPILFKYLTADELGLWYVYVAIANLAVLFEFGFDPTFARNIVYVLSGATCLNKTGKYECGASGEVDWHLLNVVIRASKAVYALISMFVAILLLSFGTFYVSAIANSILNAGVWVSWILFCVSIFLNIYFLWSLTVLRGYGDVAAENRAKTYAKIIQLVVSSVLLACGMGLLGASVGYLANALVLRALSFVYLKRHRDIEEERRRDRIDVDTSEIKEVLLSIGGIAWKDGVVSFSNYASTQAITLISSIFLGLRESGMYSISLQLATAVVTFASAYPKSFFPSMQAAVAQSNLQRQREYVSSGVVAYWVLCIAGLIGVLTLVVPVMPIIKPGSTIDAGLFVLLCVYLALWNQHCLYCNYIVSMNEIPYMWGFLLASVLGLILSSVFCGPMKLGPLGIVAGQGLSQLLYNNWKWPKYLCEKLGYGYFASLGQGIEYWANKIRVGYEHHSQR